MVSAEFEMLLLCCRQQPDGSRCERLESLLRDEPDWNDVLRLARCHGMLPGLFSLLGKQGWRRVPAAAAGQLKTFYRENLVRNLMLLRELHRLLDLFSAGSVRVLPVKGPVLAVQAYGDPAARTFHDLDLLIAPDDLSAACRLLAGAGYVPEIELSERDAGVYAAQEKYLIVNHSRTGLAVELQWGYLPGYFCYPYDFEALWRERRPVTLGNREVETLSEAETTRFLCLHGFKHGWDRLSLVGDVAHFIARRQPALPRSPRAVSAGLLLVRELAPGSVPETLLPELLHDRSARLMAERWRHDLVAGGPRIRSIFANGMTYLAAQPGIAPKLSFLWRLLFTPTVEDWKHWGFNTRRRLYPLLRPLRLMASHAFRRAA